ncbi:MAG TPA: hypothetical protein PLC40_04095 [Candidatus Hydrogenedentes bacterium]|nr:hypothetical protein [Candidatus Hydrogenedentota bacterium]
MNQSETQYYNGSSSSVRTGNVKVFLVMDALYLLVVFGWTLGLSPLGIDFAALARPDRLGPVAGELFSGMLSIFGGYAWMYFLVNLALLYGCMALLLVLTRILGKGPWWLGSIAAVLFMANPIKTEGVLLLSGLRYLLPGLLGLVVLLVYACSRLRQKFRFLLLPPAAYIGAVLACPDLVPLFLVLMVLEGCFFREFPGRSRRLWPIVIVGFAMYFISGQWAMEGAWQPARVFVPLYLVLYPIGLLPDTVALFESWPVLGWGCGMMLIALALLLMRGARTPLFTFGLLGAVSFRLLQGGRGVDPVTLAGGGILVIPLALLSLAVAGGFQALLERPRWRASVVRLSTLFCVVAMACQVWTNVHWLQGGHAVRRFRQAAMETAAQHPGQLLAVAPDLQYSGTVPVMYAQSVYYDTPFSTALPVTGLMPLSLAMPATIDVLHYSPEKMTVSVRGHTSATPDKPRLFSRAWWQRRSHPPEPARLDLEAGARPFPVVRVPYE